MVPRNVFERNALVQFGFKDLVRNAFVEVTKDFDEGSSDTGGDGGGLERDGIAGSVGDSCFGRGVGGTDGGRKGERFTAMLKERRGSLREGRRGGNGR